MSDAGVFGLSIRAIASDNGRNGSRIHLRLRFGEGTGHGETGMARIDLKNASGLPHGCNSPKPMRWCAHNPKAPASRRCGYGRAPRIQRNPASALGPKMPRVPRASGHSPRRKKRLGDPHSLPAVPRSTLSSSAKREGQGPLGRGRCP